jgi:hypothetical protein
MGANRHRGRAPKVAADDMKRGKSGTTTTSSDGVKLKDAPELLWFSIWSGFAASR